MSREEALLDIDIPRLCRNISSNLGKSDCRAYLSDLLLVCNGPQYENFEVPFTKILSSEESLLCLLRIKNTIDFLKDKPESSVRIIEALLKLPLKPWDIIHTLTLQILNCDYSGKDVFVKSLWAKRGTNDLPAEVALLLIKEDHTLLENHFLEIYQSDTEESTDIWKSSESFCFVTWCSQSSEVFSILTNILNQFLIFAKSKTVILKLIRDFITNLIRECAEVKKDFVLLYPLQYQAILSLLIIDPEINPCFEDVKETLKLLEKNDLEMALLLYSHFPKWLPND